MGLFAGVALATGAVSFLSRQAGRSAKASAHRTNARILRRKKKQAKYAALAEELKIDEKLDEATAELNTFSLEAGLSGTSETFRGARTGIISRSERARGEVQNRLALEEDILDASINQQETLARKTTGPLALLTDLANSALSGINVAEGIGRISELDFASGVYERRPLQSSQTIHGVFSDPAFNEEIGRYT